MKIIALAVGVLMVMACSGDDGALNGVTGTQPPDDRRTEEQLSADRAAAASAVLTLSDFPSGWEAQTREQEEEDGPDLTEEMADCLGVDESLFADPTVTTESDTFVLDDAEVESDITMHPTLEWAQQGEAVFSNPRARDCYADAVERLISYNMEHPDVGEDVPEDLEIGDVTVGTVLFGDLGDYTFAWRVTVPVSAEGFNVDLYLDIVGIRVGRATAVLTFYDVFSPFDQQLAQELAQTVADRLPVD